MTIPIGKNSSLKIDRNKFIAEECEDWFSFVMKTNAMENVEYIDVHPTRCKNGSYKSIWLVCGIHRCSDIKSIKKLRLGGRYSICIGETSPRSFRKYVWMFFVGTPASSNPTIVFSISVLSLIWTGWALVEVGGIWTLSSSTTWKVQCSSSCMDFNRNGQLASPFEAFCVLVSSGRPNRCG